MDERLQDMEYELMNMGAALLGKRLRKLKCRRFVLFPYFRIKLLLKRIRYLMGE